MRRPNRCQGWRRPLVTALVAVQLAGCYRWETISIGPRGAIDGEPSRVRITEVDTGEPRELSFPQIRRDSIFARELPEGMPLSRVQRMEARVVDESRTARNALVTVIPIAVLMIALSNSMDDFDLGQAWRN